ncbi:MAG: hypothetical protein PHP50_04035 [Lachnospiraceae bacterium]|nr:hypothetical protein [Lachnospiraceae bacterium]
MKMKKLLAVSLVAAMSLSMAGCGKDVTQGAAAPAETAAAETTAAATTESKETAAAEVTSTDPAVTIISGKL